MANPLEEVGGWAKEHPAATVGIIIVAGLGVALLLGSGGSSHGQASATGLSDAQFGDLVNAQSAQQQAAAQAAAQSAQESYNLQLAAQQAGAQLALQVQTDQTQLAEAGIAEAIANNKNNLDYQLGTAGLSAQLAGLESNNATSEHLATIAANENTTIAATNASVSIDQSDNLTKLGIVQANDNANVAIHVAQANETSSIVGSALGFIAGLF